VAEPELTVAVLKQLMDERDRRYSSEVANAKESLQAALVAMKEATMERKHDLDKWQISANEWRQTMNDKDRNFVTHNTLWGWLMASVMLVLAVMQILERIGKP